MYYIENFSNPIQYSEIGLLVWGYPIFIWFNFIAFLITLILIFRLGAGDLIKPVYFFALSFLMPVLTILLFGISYLWVVPIIQSLFVFAGIYLLMKVLGIFELISKK